MGADPLGLTAAIGAAPTNSTVARADRVMMVALVKEYMLIVYENVRIEIV
jgi:hypothetical protein